MTYQEIISLVRQWPPHEQARLVTALVNLLAEQLEPPARLTPGSSLDLVRGMLKPDGSMLAGDTLKEEPVPYSASGKDLMRFAGVISPEDAEQMRQVIELGCEQAAPYQIMTSGSRRLPSSMA